MSLSKNVLGLCLALIAFSNVASADEATLSNRYNYARSELIRLEDYCGVTNMIVHNNFANAPRVSMANFISEEEVEQYESRIRQLQSCVPQQQQSPFCKLSKEKLTGIPAAHLEKVISQYTQIGMKTTIENGSAPGLFDVTAIGLAQQPPEGVICN